MSVPADPPRGQQVLESPHAPLPLKLPRGSNLATFIQSNPSNVPSSKIAYVSALNPSYKVTREEVFQYGHQLAWSLRSVSKMQKGDRVAIFTSNNLWYPILVHANLLAGLVNVTLNPAYTPEELAHPLADAQPKIVFTTRELVQTVRTAAQQIGWNGKLIVTDDEVINGPEVHIKQLLAKANGKSWKAEWIEEPENEDALIGYSSGTSGKPKGVQLTHGNLIQMCKMMIPGRHGDLSPDDVGLAVLPFQHIFALFHSLLFDLFFGVKVIVVPRFSLKECLGYIQKFKVTKIEVVPPIVLLLAKDPSVDEYDLSSLKWMMSGAAPLSADLSDQVETRLNAPTKGGKLTIIQGYGLTETSPCLSAGRLSDYHQHKGSIGILFPNLQARLVDPDTGLDVAFEIDAKTSSDVGKKRSKPGELWVRGPNIMKGYLNRPDATKEAVNSEGYFRTGDIAIVEDGEHLYIVDRLKELIKYKGFQVAPATLESLLLSHPKVADCAVISVYSAEQATELPLAYIVPAMPCSASDSDSAPELAREVQEWVAGRVANHMKLRGGVRVRDAIPKSPSGKILRRVLRDEVKESEADGRGAKAKL